MTLNARHYIASANTKLNMRQPLRLQARWAVIHALKIHKGDIHTAAAVTKKPIAFVKKWQQHFQKYKNVNDRPRTGRPGKIDAALRAAAVTLVAEEQSVPVATAILKERQLLHASIHAKTVLRAVKKEMVCKHVQTRPILNAMSRARRVRFAQQHHHPDRMIAIDSTYFTLGTVQRGRRYWTKKGTPVVAGRPNKSQQLHVYGGITAHGKTRLVFVSGTTGHKKPYYGKKGRLSGVGAEEFQDIMRDSLVPDAQQLAAAAGVGSFTWLIDNAPAHSATSSKQFLTNEGISCCKDWPANSPDLNPIENGWAWMKKRVYSRHYNSLADLRRAVLAAWAALPDSMCRSLMHSLQRRKALCLARNGGHTGY